MRLAWPCWAHGMESSWPQGESKNMGDQFVSGFMWSKLSGFWGFSRAFFQGNHRKQSTLLAIHILRCPIHIYNFKRRSWWASWHIMASSPNFFSREVSTLQDSCCGADSGWGVASGVCFSGTELRFRDLEDQRLPELKTIGNPYENGKTWGKP